MKSFNVDALLTDRAVIEKAIIKVCKSKRKKSNGRNRKYQKAQWILRNLDKHVDGMLEMMTATKEAYRLQFLGHEVPPEIRSQMYVARKCEAFKVKDGPAGKERDIVSVPLYPDQVVHQLIIEAGGPAIMSGFYYHSYGSIPGKGAHRGQRAIKRVISHHCYHDKSEIKYIAKLDITKCYPSIQHKSIEALLRKRFRGWFFIDLCMAVLDSYHTKIVGGEKVGLSIGYSLSQWFCNFALTPFDNFIKHNLKVKHYIRYIDDMVLFGRNKKVLHEQVKQLALSLAEHGLIIKANWQVFRFDFIDSQGKRRGRDLDFLGLRFFRDKTILRRRLSLKIRRQAKQLKKKRPISTKSARSFMARVGWLRHCNSSRYYRKHIKPFVNIRKIKDVIRNEDRKHNNATAPV